MFFQRLDAAAQGPQLVGGAVGVYHCRNRELRGDLQRWMQQDPNGTGYVVLGWGAMHGGAGCGANPQPQISTWFPDGLNRFNYLRASPALRADPLGLLDFTLKGMLLSTATSGIIGGMSNAYAVFVQGGSNRDVLFAGGRGFIAGAVGGAIGYSFGAATGALFGRVSGIIVGSGASGAAGGATGGILNGRSWHEIGEDAKWGAIMGLASGLAGSAVLSRHWASGHVADAAQEAALDALDWVFGPMLGAYGAAADEIRR